MNALHVHMSNWMELYGTLNFKVFNFDNNHPMVKRKLFWSYMVSDGDGIY